MNAVRVRLCQPKMWTFSSILTLSIKHSYTQRPNPSIHIYTHRDPYPLDTHTRTHTPSLGNQPEFLLTVLSVRIASASLTLIQWAGKPHIPLRQTERRSQSILHTHTTHIGTFLGNQPEFLLTVLSMRIASASLASIQW